MKTIQQLRAESQEFYDRHHREMEAAVRSELPVGKRVKWLHGAYDQYGRVTRYGYGSTVFAKNERSSAEVRKDAWEFTPA